MNYKNFNVIKEEKIELEKFLNFEKESILEFIKEENQLQSLTEPLNYVNFCKDKSFLEQAKSIISGRNKMHFSLFAEIISKIFLENNEFYSVSPTKCFSTPNLSTPDKYFKTNMLFINYKQLMDEGNRQIKKAEKFQKEFNLKTNYKQILKRDLSKLIENIKILENEVIFQNILNWIKKFRPDYNFYKNYFSKLRENFINQKESYSLFSSFDFIGNCRISKEINKPLYFIEIKPKTKDNKNITLSNNQKKFISNYKDKFDILIISPIFNIEKDYILFRYLTPT